MAKDRKPSLPEHFMYKNRLQEYTQRSALPFPSYRTINLGTQHAPEFSSSVLVGSITYASCQRFTNKKAAEQHVSRVALEGISKKMKDEGSPIILEAEKTRKVSPENTNEDIIGTEAANCGNTRMDRRTINEGEGQDDIQVSFLDTQFPSIPNVPAAAKPPHGGGIKIKASRSRKKPEEVVPIDEHGPAKRTRSKTSATKSSSGSLSIRAVSQKGEVSSGTNILTSNVAVVISESPEHEGSDKYNDRVNYEDSPCLNLSSHDDAHPHSAKSQGLPKHFMYKNRLQEYTQRSALPFPSYRTINLGTQHAPEFSATVLVGSITYASCQRFTNKKAAEQDVARVALEGISKKMKDE